MHHHHSRLLRILLLFILLVAAAQTIAAGSRPAVNDFLIQLADLQPISGFPPALFLPENQPSRYEIAFFLYQLDQRMAVTARKYALDLKGVLHRMHVSSNPETTPEAAAGWTEWAVREYRRLLAEYGRELTNLGCRLRPDAYPIWSRGGGNVPGY